ncbi:MAG: hypothetical protein LBP36_04365 [Oscillospiraceae bacterium]|nr:hypothetical protein [Oscillospiraceae bacterium]
MNNEIKKVNGVIACADGLALVGTLLLLTPIVFMDIGNCIIIKNCFLKSRKNFRIAIFVRKNF